MLGEEIFNIGYFLTKESIKLIPIKPKKKTGGA